MDTPEINTVMSWLEGLSEDNWVDFNSDSEVQNIAKSALKLLDEQAVEIQYLKNVIKVKEQQIDAFMNLLKEHQKKQEGLQPAWQDRTQEHVCQKCGGIVYYEDNYCSKCGQAVKWK